MVGARTQTAVAITVSVIGAALRYYQRMGAVAIDLARATVPAYLRSTAPDGGAVMSSVTRIGSGGATVLIEAEAGKHGIGVFQIESHATTSVSTAVRVTPLVAPGGETAEVSVKFEPSVLTLEPGHHALVQVSVAVNETLRPGVRYAGFVQLPGLSDLGVPIVVRRRPSPIEPTASPAVAPESPSSTGRRRRPSGRKHT
jgi:hypothetical protein